MCVAGTPGKSGSLFFFSNDMRFIIKTLPKREVPHRPGSPARLTGPAADA